MATGADAALGTDVGAGAVAGVVAGLGIGLEIGAEPVVFDAAVGVDLGAEVGVGLVACFGVETGFTLCGIVTIISISAQNTNKYCYPLASDKLNISR